eukprot:g68227.t1
MASRGAPGEGDDSDDDTPPAPPGSESTLQALGLPASSAIQKIRVGQDSPMYWEELFEKKNELLKFGRALEQQLQNLFDYQGDELTHGKKLPPSKKPPTTSSISPERTGGGLFQKSTKSPAPKSTTNQSKGLFAKKFKALPNIGGKKEAVAPKTNSASRLPEVAEAAEEKDAADNKRNHSSLLSTRTPRSPASLEKAYQHYKEFVVEHVKIRDEGGTARYEKITSALLSIALAQEQLLQELDGFLLEGRTMVEQIMAMERLFKEYEALHMRYYTKFQEYLKLKNNSDKSKLVRVDQKLSNKKKELELKRFDLDALIRAIDAKRETTVLNPLHGLMNSYTNFFKQGYDLLAPMDGDLKTLAKHVKQSNKHAQKQVSASKEEKNQNLREYEKEAESVKASSNAPAVSGSGIRDLETTQKTSDSSEKNGYLYMPDFHHTVAWVELQGMALEMQPMNGLRPDTRQYPQMLPIQLCTVKEARETKLRFAFSVITPQKTVTLQADNQKDMMEWISVIQNAILSGLDNNQQAGGKPSTTSPEQKKQQMEEEKERKAKEKMLKDLQKIKGNQICADCDSPDPDWVSLNLGILICMECSGVHRAMGVHISKVRSIKLDKIDNFLMQYLKTIGNKNSNKIWEASLISNPAHMKMRPTRQSDRGLREQFIRDKYEKKQFVGPNKNKPVAKLNSRLWKAIEDDNSIAMLEALAWGADPNHSNPAEDGRTALHQAVMYRNPILVELLLQHPGTAIDSKEVRGWTPLHYAAYQDDLETVEMILLRGGTRLANVTDGEGLTPLESATAHNEEALECAKILEDAQEKAKARKR